MKEEALKLAEFLEKNMVASVAILGDVTATHIVSTIRRLVEELDKQEHCCPDCGCHFVGEYPFNNATQTKPTITKLDGKVVAVTMTDDEHRVHEVLWEAPKPLSDEEILDIWYDFNNGSHDWTEYIKFARTIEERHGIK